MRFNWSASSAVRVAILVVLGGVIGACSEPTSRQLPDILPEQVTAGIEESCGLATNGDTYCWGAGFALVPTKIDDAPRFIQLGVGVMHFCGLTATGTAYCRGRNTSGELGDGTTTTRITTMPVAGGLTFASLATAIFHSCGLTPQGVAYCWGSNTNGQLGNGTAGNRSVPTPVAGDLRFSAIDTYGAFTCALALDGAAYCWGANNGGSLGDGTTAERNVPTPVATDMRFARIAAGATPCALTAAGVPYCWGSAYGLTPAPVADAPALASLSAGGGHTCGLAAAGEAYCWGFNSKGQLGDGTSDSRVTARPVAGGLKFSQISATGWQHTCAVTTAREAYCWGHNEGGQLGDGTTTQRLTPAATARWDAP